jgi:hypothetical protein
VILLEEIFVVFEKCDVAGLPGAVGNARLVRAMAIHSGEFDETRI